MCEDCYRATCSPRCPYHIEGAHAHSCALCGETFSEGDGYLGEGDLCAACAEMLTLDDLLCLMRLSGVGELLMLLGYCVA